MIQTRPRRGHKPGFRARRPARHVPRVKRSYSVDAKVNDLILRLARQLEWSESWVVNVLLQSALLPFRDHAEVDEAAVARQLMRLELERIGLQEA